MFIDCPQRTFTGAPWLWQSRTGSRTRISKGLTWSNCRPRDWPKKMSEHQGALGNWAMRGCFERDVTILKERMAMTKATWDKRIKAVHGALGRTSQFFTGLEGRGAVWWWVTSDGSLLPPPLHTPSTAHSSIRWMDCSAIIIQLC